MEETVKPTASSTPWWVSARYELLEIANQQSPCYVYAQSCLDQQVQKLLNCPGIDKVFFSVKSNNNEDILKHFFNAGIGFECVSIYEVYKILKLFPTIDKKRLLFTPNFAAKTEYQQALALDILLTIDNLYILEHWGDLFKDRDVMIRVDLDVGKGHHKYVVTGGYQSKFGITAEDLPRVKQLTTEHGIVVAGLHTHSGSGILDNQHWQDIFSVFMPSLDLFPSAKIIDLGGGLGIPEHPDQVPLDFSAVCTSLTGVKRKNPERQIWLEPGRYLVAEAGVLLAKVTQIKTKGPSTFVGIETGMNSLIRPALYDSYHLIVNLSRLDEPSSVSVDIVGPICESGDTLGNKRLLPPCQEGDVILIANVGAYGHSMSSYYNLRNPALEVYAAHL